MERALTVTSVHPMWGEEALICITHRTVTFILERKAGLQGDCSALANRTRRITCIRGLEAKEPLVLISFIWEEQLQRIITINNLQMSAMAP